MNLQAVAREMPKDQDSRLWRREHHGGNAHGVVASRSHRFSALAWASESVGFVSELRSSKFLGLGIEMAAKGRQSVHICSMLSLLIEDSLVEVCLSRERWFLPCRTAGVLSTVAVLSSFPEV